ncbi:thymidine phosphorylase, partial [Acinetobacter baumannii]|nr:thymidine phosphorylase [Acinetobacter baumannii]
RNGVGELVATLNVGTGDWPPTDVAALSEAAWNALRPERDGYATITHAEPPPSAAALRAKVFGQRLDEADFLQLMRDTVANRLSDIELAAF